MTIAVAVRTSSAVVFATDSKLTAKGLAGTNPDGTSSWVTQTYDNATKVVHDRSGQLMALATGVVNLGNTMATDFIASYEVPPITTRDTEDFAIDQLIVDMNDRRLEFWSASKVPLTDWPGPTMLLAAPSSKARIPRVWRVDLSRTRCDCQEVLTSPGIQLEGAYDDVFALLYGISNDVLEKLGPQIGVDGHVVAAGVGKLVPPLERINLHVMPLQDAIDLAVFLASVQIEMDRFLPGIPACGGPIDVMVLRMAPRPEILVYPGKTLHHPKQGS